VFRLRELVTRGHSRHALYLDFRFLVSVVRNARRSFDHSLAVISRAGGIEAGEDLELKRLLLMRFLVRVNQTADVLARSTAAAGRSLLADIVLLRRRQRDRHAGQFLPVAHSLELSATVRI